MMLTACRHPGIGVGVVDRPGSVTGPQAVAQCERLQGGHRHALPVNGIEVAQRIPDHQQAGRQARHSVIATPHRGGAARDRDLCQRCGIAQRSHSRRGKNLASRRHGLSEIRWRTATIDWLGDSQHPGVVFISEQQSPRGPVALVDEHHPLADALLVTDARRGHPLEQETEPVRHPCSGAPPNRRIRRDRICGFTGSKLVIRYHVVQQCISTSVFCR
jgi:hypothetical protein